MAWVSLLRFLCLCKGRGAQLEVLTRSSIHKDQHYNRGQDFFSRRVIFTALEVSLLSL